MLAAIGVERTEELFEQIPDPLRLGRALGLPDGLGEAEVFDRLRELAERNADCESQVCFIGAGMYDHYVPALVDAITGRSEFLTPYTPYQPEISSRRRSRS
jgi:glycine dehydrogenase subunit 1